MKKIKLSPESSSHQRNLRIAILTGDPAGIGPEVTLKAVQGLSDSRITPIIFGTSTFINKFYGSWTAEFKLLSDTESLHDTVPGKHYFFDIAADLQGARPGEGSIKTGLASRLYIDAAVNLWKNGLVDAIVTGPVNKGFIEKSGTPFTGHTEYIADLIGEKDPFMMMFSSEYRVLLVTTHTPVSCICSELDMNRLLKVIRMGHEAMRFIDGGNVKIAVSGLDPHCGDEGAIGDFDLFVTQPAISEARNEGIDVYGPYSADTLFIGERWKRYNLAIAHYHDQGLIPFKLLTFGKGVNVTLGLPITRTSVDHGTAYDIAGKGIADYGSMREAIDLAYRLESGKQ